MQQQTQPDCASLIPLDLIRSHLKIEDYQGVSDDQLALYAAAAVEAFQNTTGRIVAKRRLINEPIRVPRWSSLLQAAKARYQVGISHPADDGVITLEWNGNVHVMTVRPGAQEFEWPTNFARPALYLWNLWSASGLESGCASCGILGETIPFASYVTGHGEELPPGALVGCLKYIAWQYEHPGDELATVADRAARVTSGAMQGSNNAVISSGAYAEWRQYKTRIAR